MHLICHHNFNHNLSAAYIFTERNTKSVTQKYIQIVWIIAVSYLIFKNSCDQLLTTKTRSSFATMI